MTARDILGSKEEKTEAKAAKGSGTRVSGYVDSPVAKKCSTCEYYAAKNRCDNKVVMRDPQVPTDKKSKLKIVDGKDGCCSFWEAAGE